MKKLVYVGLDVHADSIVVGKCTGDEPAAFDVKLANDVPALLRRLDKLAPRKHLVVCYEAGPTGFGLARQLNAAGIYCEVVAPSLIPKRQGEKVKTDRRDAAKLARLLRIGELTPVSIPTEETEAIRDLERAREDAVYRQNRIRNQLSKFLLRHNQRFEAGKTPWTKMYVDWIRKLKFQLPAQQRTVQSYLRALDAAVEEVAQLTKDLAEVVETWSLKPLVLDLQALRGVSLVAAVTLAAEVHDFKRFAHPMQFMAYLGMVPSENSSGSRRRQGSITKTGNKHVRRILTEAAWSYRHTARESVDIKKRLEGLDPEIRKIAWKAQLRLNRKYRQLNLIRGKPKQVVVTAVGRELAGFVWAIAMQSAQGGPQATAA